MNEKSLLQAILRKDLKSFIYKVFTTINPSIRLSKTWYIDYIADYLEDITQNGAKRIIINIPPRCLKSISISVAWPAWLLGLDPTKRIIVASYSQHLSLKHSLDCRAIMQSPWYRQLFTQTIICPDQNKKNKYMTTEFGFRMATSIGGSITGEGGDILIVDDPHNPTHIHSSKMRNKAIEWFEQTFLSRLNDRSKGSVVIVMQRLHMQDLSAHLIAKGGWEVLKLPAISDDDKYLDSPCNSYFFAKDSSIDQERLPESLLRRIEKEMGTSNFKAQYLQSPEVNNNGMLEAKNIGFYDTMPQFEEIYQSWDTAIKVSQDSDYSVGTTWGVFESKYYLIDFICQKFEYSYLKAAVVNMAKKWLPKIILIEDKASGQSLIQDLKLANIYNIAPQKPKIDKITRFALVLPFFTLEQVLLPKNSPWSAQVTEQLTRFPYADHDDIVDSISQFLNYIKQKNTIGKTYRIRDV